MHSLDIIIARNHAAAGREAAEAFNRGDHRHCNRIVNQYQPSLQPQAWAQFIEAYDAERARGPWAEGVPAARPCVACGTVRCALHVFGESK